MWVWAVLFTAVVVVTSNACQKTYAALLEIACDSNCMEEDARPWWGSALAPQFTCAIFSCAAGCVKPDPRIYLMAVEHLGTNPGDTLYIGDGGDAELAGAERAGLRVAQAGWFVARPMTSAPFLATQEDVMRLVFE